MVTTPKIGIVSLNWNGVNHLKKFLPTAINQDLQTQISTLTSNFSEVKQDINDKFLSILETIQQNSTVKQVQTNSDNITNIQKQIYVIKQQLQLISHTLNNSPNDTIKLPTTDINNHTDTTSNNDTYMAHTDEIRKTNNKFKHELLHKTVFMDVCGKYRTKTGQTSKNLFGASTC